MKPHAVAPWFTAAAIAAGAILTLLAPARPAGAAPAAPDVAAIHAAIDSLAGRELWPGFDPRALPLAVGAKEKTWLRHHPAPPMDFEEVPGNPDLWTYAGLHDSVRANGTAMIEGVLTATLLLDPPPANASARGLAGTAIHELFHVWAADRHPQWNANELDRFLFPDADSGVIALRMLEADALGRALAAPRGAKGPAETAGWAARAVALRKQQDARLSPIAARYVNMLEIKEGLADYVRLRALGKTAGADLFPAGGDFAPEAVRERAYATGSAWALVLDRLDPAWPARFDASGAMSLPAFVDSVLAPLGAAPREPSAAELAALRAAAATAAAGIAGRMTAKREAFLAREGWTLVFVTESSEPFWVNKMDPMNMASLGGNQVLHERWLKVSSLSLMLEARDVPVLTEGVEGQPLMNGIREVTLTGLGSRPEFTDEEKQTVIRGAGFEARIALERYFTEESDGMTKVFIKKYPRRTDGRRRG